MTLNGAPPLHTDSFLPHMRDVQRCEASLRELNLMWRVIEANAKMNCPEEARTILPMIAATRRSFERLEKELVASLVDEKIANVIGEVGTQAQHVIDIVVRNLFERTADVGFLATDGELCEYVAGLRDDRAAAVERLAAYRDKYTVYDEILLLDTAGAVMAHIDGHSPIEGSADPLIAQTLASDAYVETFRLTDLRPGQAPALVYSRRMHHPHSGQPVGVLCLVFGFESELAGIFDARRDPEGRSIALLIDDQQRVIASADPGWMPVGTRVPVHAAGTPGMRVHAGREYLVQTYTPEPYQGYPGPAGWRGQVMIPVDVALHGRAGGVLGALDPALAEGLLQHARSFCPPLHEIINAADTIRRVVWNGQVMAAGHERDRVKLKTVLEQISDTGARSNSVFAEAIRDLYDTVLGASLSGARSLTHLLVDLLDRNLYERSDDCRWWAMTPALRRALVQPDAVALANVTAILQNINSLYTVYSRLVVYDAQGCIVAASQAERADGSSVIGSTIEPDTLAAVLHLAGEQAYHVTPFRPSALGTDAPTLVYHAAIRALDAPHRVVGGIGIVFNTGPEFAAMLQGPLAGRPQTQALYADRQGHVIASTDAAQPIGSRLDLPPEVLAEVLALPAGSSSARVIVRNGSYTLLGASWNAGYREFKTSDGHRDDVLALSFEVLGPVCELRRDARQRAAHAIEPQALAGGVEFATFYVDAGLTALPAQAVRGAVPGRDIAPVSLGSQPHRVGVLSRRSGGQVQSHVWVYDLDALLGGKPCTPDDSQVIVVSHGGIEIGLQVQELHGVPEFEPAQVVTAPRLAGASRLLPRMIQAEGGRLLIPVLDLDELFNRLTGGAALEPAPAELLPA